MALSVSANATTRPPPAARRRKALQCHLSVNLFQLVSTQNQVGCLFQVTKVTLSSDSSRKMAFQVLAVCGADLGSLAEPLTANSLRQEISWICLSTSFSLPCINPPAPTSMKVFSDLSLDNSLLKAGGHGSSRWRFNTTTVWEQHPRSHHKGANSMQRPPAVRVGIKLPVTVATNLNGIQLYDVLSN